MSKLSISQLLTLISTKLASGSDILASEHREVENSIVDSTVNKVTGGLDIDAQVGYNPTSNVPITSPTQFVTKEWVENNAGGSTNDPTTDGAYLREKNGTAITWVLGVKASDYSSVIGSITSDLSNKLNLNGSNANQDIDIGAFSLNAKSFKVNGTGGNGNIGFKHQSANITASTNETSLGANSSGRLVSKNDGNAIETLMYISDVLDVLNSTLTDKALSANQGRVLNNKIVALENVINAGADADNVVNTFNELLQVMSNFPETSNVLIELNNRYTKSEVDSLLAGKQNSLGYTPANKAGDTFTGAITATNLSGTNTGDETTTSIKTKLGQSSTTTDGWLSSTDWNIFNNKQSALSFTPENSANKGQANGYASLNSSGQVPSSQLPSFVDDVLEYADFASLPITGETGKIYITLNNNQQYRWSGSSYIQLVASPGTTDALTEGSTNLYFTAARVLATVITGFSAVVGVVANTDSILVAINKIVGNMGLLATKDSPTFTTKTTYNYATASKLAVFNANKELVSSSYSDSDLISSKITITTSTNITTSTQDSSSIGQNGKVVIIDNGVNAITFTLNGGVTASYLKHGTGAITVTRGSGRSMYLNGADVATATFSGAVGSTMTITEVGTRDYISIVNI